jgi:hypothetical protein
MPLSSSFAFDAWCHTECGQKQTKVCHMKILKEKDDFSLERRLFLTLFQKN